MSDRAPASASAAADRSASEASTTDQVGELMLRFTFEFPIVRVTDEGATGCFVGNVYGFELSGGPFIYTNYAYRHQFGKSEHDPHGANMRRQVCRIAQDLRAKGA